MLKFFMFLFFAVVFVWSFCYIFVISFPSFQIFSWKRDTLTAYKKIQDKIKLLWLEYQALHMRIVEGWIIPFHLLKQLNCWIDQRKCWVMSTALFGLEWNPQYFLPPTHQESTANGRSLLPGLCTLIQMYVWCKEY